MRSILRLLPFFLAPLAAVAQAVPPNVLISDQQNPNETAIAINPKNPQELMAGANTDNAYWSQDGGLTWTRQVLSSPQGVWGDPSIVCDTTGAFYYLHLTNPGNFGYNFPFIDRMQVQKTAAATAPFGLRSSFGLNPTKQQDKGWLALDRRTNALYCTWTEFDRYGSASTQDSSRILFTRSLDGAATWSAPRRISKRGGDSFDESNTVEGAVPAVGPNGEIYVSWAGPQGIVFNRSLDGGLTWLPGGERPLAALPGGWAFDVPGLDRSNGLPVTACDLSRGPHRGTLYVNWSDQRNGPADTDIWLSSSTDGGQTWSAARRVNNDPAGRQQFLTWMTVDPVTGYLWFVFYDRRNYPVGSLATDVYGARSTDGGLTFQNFRISQTFFIPDAMSFLGDYTNIAAYNNVVRPVWTRMDQDPNFFQPATSVWTALVNGAVLAARPPAHPAGPDLQLFPNPATGYLTVALALPAAATVGVQLFTLTGQAAGPALPPRRYEAGPQQLPLALTGVAPGTYLLAITAGTERRFRRVVVAP